MSTEPLTVKTPSSINEILDYLYAYQKKYNIKKLCCSNAILLYICANSFANKNLQVVSGYVISSPKKGRCNVSAHVWCEYNGEIIEPSYEYFIRPKKMYFKAYHHFKDFFRASSNQRKIVVSQKISFDKSIKEMLSRKTPSQYMVDVIKYYGW